MKQVIGVPESWCTALSRLAYCPVVSRPFRRPPAAAPLRPVRTTDGCPMAAARSGRAHDPGGSAINP